MNRFAWVSALVLFAVPCSVGFAKDEVVTPDLGTIADGKSWKVTNATPKVEEIDGKRAVRLVAKGDSAIVTPGLALLAGTEFTTGSIEIDLKGRNLRGKSFLGIAFNVANETTFEAVYFRPFNFKASDEFKGRAVQYISWPNNTWRKLRTEKPGKFEGPITPPPEPEEWFHARIEVGAKQVRVYVNQAKEPCLAVERLADGGKGRPIGFFVDTGDGVYANFKIAPAK